MTNLLHFVFISFLWYVHGEPDRIPGGQPARKGQFPFFVQLLTAKGFNENGTPIVTQCGGTLIHPEWILTAAHCYHSSNLTELEFSSMFEKNRVQAFMGTEKRITKLDTANVTVRYIKKAYLHPEFMYKVGRLLLLNDIAVVLLKEPFFENDYIKTIRLPDRTTKACYEGTIMGVGRTDFSKKYSDIVQYAHVHPKTSGELSLKDKLARPTIFYAEVKWLHGHTLQGDSGGPFVCSLNMVSPVQYGVISGGYNNTREKTAITIFESVPKHMEFIKSHVPLDSLHKIYLRKRNLASKGLQEMSGSAKKSTSLCFFITNVITNILLKRLNNNF